MAVEQAIFPEGTEPVASAWRGCVEPYAVGDPGRAAGLTVPLPDIEYWSRRDTVIDGIAIVDGHARLGELRAASVRGLAHRHYGKVRQDEYGYRRTRDGRYLVMCVADGVSSGKQSHHAAAVAAHVGVDLLAKSLTRGPLSSIGWAQFISAVADRIVQHGRRRLGLLGIADAQEYTERQVAGHMATTALYAVIDLQLVGGAHFVDLLTVGDTSAWVLRQGDRWEPLQMVKNEGEEVYSPAVTALPMLPQQPPLPTRTRVQPGEVLVLMSDGIGDALGGGTGEVGRFLAGVWRTPPILLQFAAQVEFARKSFDDDRTAVAFWPSVSS
jgi:Protein phosphatase 2C